MRRHVHVMVTFFFLCGWLELAAQQSPQSGAKELFFDPEASTPAVASPAPHLHHAPPRFDSSGRRIPHSTTPGKQRTLGLSYWIELVDHNGTPVGPVTDAHSFKSGNRIRLHFRSNADGHILLVQLGSSGTSSVLFPDPAKHAIDNRLSEGDDHVLPSPEQWFTFDRTAGTETLLVLFARSQEELDRSFPTRATMGARETGELLERVNDAPGRKDLFIETETRRPAEVGTYAVSTAGKPIIVQIVLKHR